MKKCANCGFESDGKYCPECGQEVAPKRMTVKLVFKDSTHKFYHLENPSINTIIQLIKRPGITARNYINGIRKSLVKPYKFFLSWQTIHVSCFHWLSKNYFEYVNLTGNSDVQSKKGLTQTQNLINENIKYFDYLIPLFFALIFYLFYRKKTGINFAESLSVSFYWISITLIFSTIFMFLSLIYIKLWTFPIIINIIFLTYATMRFSGNLKFSGVIKGLSIVVLSYAIYLILASSIILIYLNYFQK